MQTQPAMLSCDWGTSSLRLRLVNLAAAPQVLAEYRCDKGAASLAAISQGQTRSARFEQALQEAIEQLTLQTSQSLHGLPIVISGMAGSSIGWVPLPYAKLPFDLNGRDAACARVVPQVALKDRPVTLVSGVRDEMDVMRGEETELIGLMQLPQTRQLAERFTAVLPGTHCKHVNVAKGNVIAFRTFMTGELFSVLASHSVLRHSVSSGDQPAMLPREATGPARSAFAEGVRQSLENDLPSSLFRTRTRQLLGEQPPALNAAYLSGLLIGSEVAALGRQNSTGEPIVLCAGSAVSDWYAAALREAGLEKRTMVISPAQVDQLAVLGHAVLQRLLLAPSPLYSGERVGVRDDL